MSNREELRYKLKCCVPMAMSLANMACGFFAAACAIEGKFQLAGWLIIMATAFDGWDGRFARRLKVASRVGKQLDSLSDVITFGVAPAFLVANVVRDMWPVGGWVAGFFFTACAALRLARFNVDAERTEGETVRKCFIGFPTTGAGGLIASVVLFNEYLSAHFGDKAVMLKILPLFTVFVGIMMVSRIRFTDTLAYFVPKCQSLTFLIQLSVAGIIFILFPHLVILIVFMSYLVSGFLGLIRDRFSTTLPHRL